MRSVFARIALMFRNIHLGGAFSGIRSIIFSKSKLPQLPPEAPGTDAGADHAGAEQQQPFHRRPPSIVSGSTSPTGEPVISCSGTGTRLDSNS